MKTPPLVLFLPLLFSLSSHGFAQFGQPYTTQQQVTVSLSPSIAIVIGVFSIMIPLTFLLLMYAKFCRTGADGDLYGWDPEDQHQQGHTNGLLTPGSRFSGIDRTVIESLPFFRFSSLRGAREGLECAVCLSRFDDAENLRLLPKCKHAFHMDCIERWLESHSSCPLCRRKVEIEDLTLFKYSTSSRFLFRNSSVPREEMDLELYVEREPTADDRRTSSRFAWGGSFRKTSEKGKKEKEALLLPEGGDGGQFLHEQKHKIIVSGVVFKNRWSDVNSSDLISLKSEMLNLASRNRFSATDASSERFTAKSSAPGSRSSADETIRWIKEEMEKKRALESRASQLNGGLPAPAASSPSSSNAGTDDLKPRSLPKSMIPSGNNNRCMSEIINISRFDEVLTGRGSRGPASADCPNSGDNTKDEKVRRVWLPIARRTVQWFAGREKRPETHQTRLGTPSNV